MGRAAHTVRASPATRVCAGAYRERDLELRHKGPPTCSAAPTMDSQRCTVPLITAERGFVHVRLFALNCRRNRDHEQRKSDHPHD